MSSIGKIVGLPPVGSSYARVKDEYGSVYTVHASQIDAEAEAGEDFAYKVDVFKNESGLATTLLSDEE